MTAGPREKTDLIDYHIAHCDRKGCEEIDLGIDQHYADAWSAYIVHCRETHPGLVQKQTFVRTMTWEPFTGAVPDPADLKPFEEQAIPLPAPENREEESSSDRQEPAAEERPKARKRSQA